MRHGNRCARHSNRSVGGFENSMSGVLLRFSSVVVDDGVDDDVG